MEKLQGYRKSCGYITWCKKVKMRQLKKAPIRDACFVKKLIWQVFRKMIIKTIVLVYLFASFYYQSVSFFVL